MEGRDTLMYICTPAWSPAEGKVFTPYEVGQRVSHKTVGTTKASSLFPPLMLVGPVGSGRILYNGSHR